MDARRDAAVFRKLQGVWSSPGYGLLLEIGPAHYRVHERTRVSCRPVFEGSLEELAAFYVDLRVSPRRAAFSARRSTGVTRVHFRRLQALPRACAESDSTRAHDPVHNFEVFWHTFAERYAAFELRGVDWQAIGDAQRSRVDASTNPRRLFETFVEMLEPLADGHVELRAGAERFSPGRASMVRERLAAELGASADDPGVMQALLERLQAWRALVHDRYLAGQAQRGGGGLLEWGRLDDATGYLRIGAMAGQSGAHNRPREDQGVVVEAMARVLDDLGALPALVVDVRDNLGGYDGVALRIAGHFIDRRRLAFSKAPRKGDHYGSQQRVFVEPRAARRYGGHVQLLTSGLTTSAAEIFVLSLMQRPELTRIGEATHGELSDVMERHLPNGWTVALSNELYFAADGALYEARGIPPQVEIPFLRTADVKAERDAMLEAVLGRDTPRQARTGAPLHRT